MSSGFLGENRARPRAPHDQAVAHDADGLACREQPRHRARFCVGAIAQHEHVPSPGALDPARRRHDGVHVYQIRGERLIHHVGANAHGERQRPAGDVVGRTIIHGRVPLRLEEILGMCAEWLRHRHDERACRITAAVRRERLSGAAHLNAAQRQHVGECRPGFRIALIGGGGQHVGKRITREPRIDGAPPQADKAVDERQAIAGREPDQGFRGDQLIADDVAQMPGTTRPLCRLIDAARRLAQRVDLKPDGRAESRAGRFGENTDHVVARGGRAKAAMPPEIVRELVGDAGRAGVVQR